MSEVPDPSRDPSTSAAPPFGVVLVIGLAVGFTVKYATGIGWIAGTVVIVACALASALVANAVSDRRRRRSQ